MVLRSQLLTVCAVKTVLGLVGPGRIKGECPDEPVFVVEDPHGFAGHQQDDPGPPVGAPNPDVNEGPGVAQGHFAGVVDAVVADPVALDVDGFSRGLGLDPRPIGGGRGAPTEGTMRPDVVVVGDETIELDLELGHRGARVLALEELLERVSGPAENNDGSR